MVGFVGIAGGVGTRTGRDVARAGCRRSSGRVGAATQRRAVVRAAGSAPARVPENKRKKTIGGVIGVYWAVFVALWALLLYIPMLILHPFVKAFDGRKRRVHDFISRYFLKVPLLAMGVRPKFIGRENLPPADEAVVYVANHQSFLDIFCFGFIGVHHKFVSKIEILRLPVIGNAMTMKGDVALLRGNRKSQLKTYKDMLNTLKTGSSLAIFPEGTRSEDGRMRKFSSGAFKAAKATGVRVVPMTILGTREAMPTSTLLPIRRHSITVVVHKPLDSTTRTEQELSDAARQAIQSGLPPALRDAPETTPLKEAE